MECLIFSYFLTIIVFNYSADISLLTEIFASFPLGDYLDSDIYR